jgi:predicted nucleic acid-binding protein
MKRILVDANLVLDLLLQRSEPEKVAYALQNISATYFISTLTVHLTYHFGEREKVSSDTIDAVIDLFGILSLDGSTVKLAQEHHKGKDFEDCLQAACAELNDCDEILTRDRKFAQRSGTKLPVRLVG